MGEDEYDITVRLDSSQRNNVQDIANLYIPDKDGNLISEQIWSKGKLIKKVK